MIVFTELEETEGKWSHGLFQGTILTFVWRDWKKEYKNTFVRI